MSVVNDAINRFTVRLIAMSIPVVLCYFMANIFE